MAERTGVGLQNLLRRFESDQGGNDFLFNKQIDMILSYREIHEAILPNIIEGIIVNEKNNTPVSWTHVYIENSEEESLTTTEGEFKILSWQKFPVTLLIKHVHFETVRLTITASAQRILVFLKEK